MPLGISRHQPELAHEILDVVHDEGEAAIELVELACLQQRRLARRFGDIARRLLADGSVGDVRVTKSLDRVYGLDQEAIKAAKLWQFVPATDRDGKPVPIVVTLVLSFTIH